MAFKGLGEGHDGAEPGAPRGKEPEGPHREGPAQREEDSGARAERRTSLMRGWLTEASRTSLKTGGRRGGAGVQVAQSEPTGRAADSQTRMTAFWSRERESCSVVSDSLRPHGLQHASLMPSNHFILCRPLLLPPSIFLSIRVFSSESALPIRWLKYWSFSFSLSPSSDLEWVAFPSSRGSSQPRDQTQVSRIAGGFFISWVTSEAQEYWSG